MRSCYYVRTYTRHWCLLATYMHTHSIHSIQEKFKSWLRMMQIVRAEQGISSSFILFISEISCSCISHTYKSGAQWLTIISNDCSFVVRRWHVTIEFDLFAQCNAMSIVVQPSCIELFYSEHCTKTLFTSDSILTLPHFESSGETCVRRIASIEHFSYQNCSFWYQTHRVDCRSRKL